MNGIMNIYKEPGYTSFDVVARLRGILKQKKIGHTGTLDPDAEGVLVVCLGSATKLCEMLTDKDKEYTATLLLGVTTDTEDTSGRALSKTEVTCTEALVRDVIMSFVGKQQQVPPMYSAIKQDGKRLYELAHAGISVDRPPRPIEIYHIEILEVQLPRVRFKVQCSKGTYIRSLCRDIGERLCCGGCMEHLLRNRVSRFTVESAHTLSEVEQMKEQGMLFDVIAPIDSLFPDFGKLICKPQSDRFLYNGNPLSLHAFSDSLHTERLDDGTRFFIYDSNRQLKGMYEYRHARGLLMPYKMFLQES